MRFPLEVLKILRKRARELNEANANNRSAKIYSERHNEIAMLGEFEFSQFTGTSMNTILTRRGGDGGKDNTIYLGYSVDVKTFRKAGHLLVNPGEVIQGCYVLPADIYVLAQSHKDEDGADLLGWEWAINVAKTPIMDYCNLGNEPTHGIPRGKLRSMEELDFRLLKLRMGS